MKSVLNVKNSIFDLYDSKEYEKEFYQLVNNRDYFSNINQNEPKADRKYF